MVLDAATSDNGQILLPFLDNLLNGIHAHVSYYRYDQNLIVL